MPLPPPSERRRIVIEIRRLLSGNDQLTQEVELKLRRTANLRHSILAHAFANNSFSKMKE